MFRVISKKLAVKSGSGSGSNFTEYVHKLTECSKTQPGFVSSQNFWCCDDEYLYVMTDWKSKRDWDNWKISTTRKDIHETYTQYVESENFDFFRRYDKHMCGPNIFLL